MYKGFEPCGDYCKNLSPDRERAIIHRLLMMESGTLLVKATSGKVGDKKYLISAQWWREWCDYVNFDMSLDLVEPQHYYSA